ncbi:MAG: hypothetical protein ACNA8P_00860, partial [Phycisphaerales bacterium]
MHATIMLSLMQHPPEDVLTRLPAWLEFTLLLVVPATLAVLIQTTIWRLLRRVTRAEGRSPTRRLVERTAMPASLLSGVLGVSMGVVLSGERGV